MNIKLFLEKLLTVELASRDIESGISAGEKLSKDMCGFIAMGIAGQIPQDFKVDFSAGTPEEIIDGFVANGEVKLIGANNEVAVLKKTTQGTAYEFRTPGNVIDFAFPGLTVPIVNPSNVENVKAQLAIHSYSVAPQGLGIICREEEIHFFDHHDPKARYYSYQFGSNGINQQFYKKADVVSLLGKTSEEEVDLRAIDLMGVGRKLDDGEYFVPTESTVDIKPGMSKIRYRSEMVWKEEQFQTKKEPVVKSMVKEYMRSALSVFEKRVDYKTEEFTGDIAVKYGKKLEDELSEHESRRFGKKLLAGAKNLRDAIISRIQGQSALGVDQTAGLAPVLASIPEGEELSQITDDGTGMGVPGR